MSLVGSTTSTSLNTTTLTGTRTGVGAGALLVLTVAWTNLTTNTIAAPSGWLTAENPAGQNNGVTKSGASIFYKEGSASGSHSFSITLDATSAGDAVISEWPAGYAPSALNVHTNNGSTTGTSGDTGTTGASQQGVLVIAALGVNTGTGPAANGLSSPASAGYTSLGLWANEGTNAGGEHSYKEGVASGTQTGSWTWTSAASWVGVVATFILVPPVSLPHVTPWLKTAGGIPLMGVMAPGAVPDSAAAVVSITGTLATTNADDTLAAAGTTTVTGTLARTNGNDTSAASGTTTVTGTLVRTNANDTSATTGTTTLVGTLATTNANDSLSAAGVVGSATGTVAVTNANDTVSASGVVTPPSDSQPSGGFVDYGTARERRRLAEKAHRRVEEGMGADAPLPLPQDEPDQQRIRRKTITRADLLRAPTLPGLDVSLDVAFIAARQRRQRDEEELLLFS